MEKDLANGDHKIDPITYPHNELIAALFDKAKNRAWAKIARDPKVAKLIAAQKAAEAADINRGRGDYERTDIKFKQQKTFLTCLLNNYASELQRLFSCNDSPYAVHWYRYYYNLCNRLSFSKTK